MSYLFYKMCFGIGQFWAFIKLNPRIVGKENIPLDRPVILVANHQSNYDFLLMGITTKRQIHFLAKHTLFKGLLKPILQAVGAISVNREKKNKEALIEAQKYLENNEVIGIFPEGTFNHGKLLDFKFGAVKLASLTHALIVPLTINGPFRRNKVEVIIDKPIYVQSDDLERENKKLKEIIRKNLRG